MIVAIDIETADDRGASWHYFRKDFRVFSLSLAWREEGNLKQWFSADPDRIAHKIVELSMKKHQLVAHNIHFEAGVLTKLFPRCQLNWFTDTMRLAQLRDGGGEEFSEPTLTFEQEMSMELGEITEKDIRKEHAKTKGLSLESCARRFLPGYQSHKKEAHDWLKLHHGIKKNFGQYLHLLPPEELERYNNSDTEITLLLWEEFEQWFSTNNVDWRQDWELFWLRGRLVSDAFVDGVLIDRVALEKYICQVEAEIEEMENSFREEFREQLIEVRRRRYMKIRQDYCLDPNLKSDRARNARLARLESGALDKDWAVFNIGSALQLQLLFCDLLGIVPKFLTPKGSPSYKSTHLSQWGRGGEILLKRKKRLIVLQQCINVYLSSSYDGRVHASVRSAGTRSNRVSGGRSGV